MSVIQGCFYDFPSEDDRDEFFRRLVQYWVKDYTPSQVMKDLRSLVEDKSAQLQDFVRRYSDKKLVIFELGIGMRNTLIKQPLMQLTAQLPSSRYITLNLAKELYIPSGISARSIGLAGDIVMTLKELNEG